MSEDFHLWKKFSARFSGVVYPRDTLMIEGWKDTNGRYVIHSRTDWGIVLSHAYTMVA